MGLAVHIGSQICDLAPLSRHTQRFDIASLIACHGLDVPCLDLGGGVGVDKQQRRDFSAYGALVTRLLKVVVLPRFEPAQLQQIMAHY